MRKYYWKAGLVTVLGCIAAVSLSTAQTTNSKSVIPPPGPMPTGVFDMVSGMPAAVDVNNLYSEIASSKLSSNVAGALERVYVPNRGENTV